MSGDNNQERNYIAFISYRHKPLDKEAAERIQRAIEHYTVPKEFRDRVGGKRLGMVFRDEDELPISSNLSDSILYALDHSKYLIVICTPDLPLSKWCEQEISYFISTHDRDHVLAVLADGEPEKSFSPYLLHNYDEEGNITGDIEPLAANIAGENHRISKNFRKEIVRIYAALLGCPFDALWQRERRARTNRIAALLGVVMAAMAVFLGVVLSKNSEIRKQSNQILEQNAQIMEQNSQITEQNGQITEQNRQITEKNRQISEQNQDLQRQLSRTLVDGGYSALETYDIKGALQNGVEALLDEESAALYDHRAEALLNEALGSYRIAYRQSRILYEQEAEITYLETARDGSCAVIADELGAVSCIEVPEGALRWKTETFLPGQTKSFTEETELFVIDSADAVICKNYKNVVALSMEDGSVLWEFRYRKGGNNFRAISEDGSRLALLDTAEEATDKFAQVTVLDTSTGEVISSVNIGGSQYTLEPSGILSRFGYNYGAVFSENGRQLDIAAIATALTEEGERADSSTYAFFQIDLEAQKIVRAESLPLSIWDGALNIVCGLHRDADGLFFALYAYNYGGVITVNIPADKEEDMTWQFEHQNIRAESGFPSVWTEHRLTPMLADEHIALVFLDNSMLVYNRKSGELKKSLDLTGAIRDAFWLDAEEEIVEIVTEAGQFCMYDLEADPDSFSNGYNCDSFDQKDIRLVRHVGSGLKLDMTEIPDGGMYLTVREDRPGQLLMVQDISDPALKRFPDDPEVWWSSPAVRISPSGSRVLAFYYDSLARETLVVACDAATGEELERQTFPVWLSYYGLTMLDDDHFLSGFTIYGMDGSVSWLEGITEENLSNYEYRGSDFHSATISDGRVVTIIDQTSSWQVRACTCWIDGKLVSASEDPSSGFALLDSDIFKMGSNGYFIGYGTYAYENASGEAVKEETPGFIAFDIVNGARYFPKDQNPEAKDRFVAPGTEKPLFACAYGDGSVYLYDIAAQTAKRIATAYGEGELKAICLAEGDEYLLALTISGQLDCYDLQSEELVFSERPATLQGTLPYAISCRKDEERDRLHVFLGEDYAGTGWLCIDTAAWVITAECDDEADAWFRQNNCIYLCKRVDDEYRLEWVKVRSVAELADWARKELETYASAG